MIKIETDMMLTIRFLCFRIVRKKRLSQNVVRVFFFVYYELILFYSV